MNSQQAATEILVRVGTVGRYYSGTDTQEQQADLNRRAASRMTGVGREQYAEDEDAVQRFEGDSVSSLIVSLEEEVIDALNYLGMIHIQAQNNYGDIDTGRWHTAVSGVRELWESIQDLKTVEVPE